MAAKLKASYTVKELAEMAGLSKRQMSYRLRQGGLLPKGKPRCKVHISLGTFRHAFPDLWSDMVMMARIKK